MVYSSGSATSFFNLLYEEYSLNIYRLITHILLLIIIIIRIDPAFLVICFLISLLRSQGILHSFSGTETDRIWPYINSLLSTKMHTLPSDVRQTQTP